MERVDYTHKDCCLNCQAFCWWDDMWVCTMQMKIHQYGIGNVDRGYVSNPWMTHDIDITMKTPKTCEDYMHEVSNEWQSKENTSSYIIEEYKKMKELEKLEIDLENHVKDKWGVYEMIKKVRGW
jgi:hypothetical protein